MQLGPGCAYRPLRSPHVLNQSEKTLSSHIQAAGISSLTRACIFRRRQGAGQQWIPCDNLFKTVVYVPCRRTRVQNLSKRDLAGLPRAGKHKAQVRPQQEGGRGRPAGNRAPAPTHPRRPDSSPEHSPRVFAATGELPLGSTGPSMRRGSPGGERPPPPPTAH